MPYLNGSILWLQTFKIHIMYMKVKNCELKEFDDILKDVYLFENNEVKPNTSTGRTKWISIKPLALNNIID